MDPNSGNVQGLYDRTLNAIVLDDHILNIKYLSDTSTICHFLSNC